MMRQQGFSWHITCWDYRGHGDSSSDPEAGSNLWTYAMDLCILTQHIRTTQQVEPSQKFWCLGHSIGGAIGIMAQILQPNLFSGCLFIEPIVLPPPFNLEHHIGSMFLSNQAAKKRNEFSSIDEVKSLYLSKKDSPIKNWHRKVQDWYFKSAFLQRTDGSVSLKCDKGCESNVYKSAALNGVWNMLKYFKCDTVWILYGDETSHYRKDWIVELCKNIPNAQLQTVKGKDHWMPMTDPKWTSTQIIRFCVEMSPMISML